MTQNNNEVPALVGQATPEQIAAWKMSHPLGIYQVANAEGYVGYFKNPSRKEVACALSKITADDAVAHLEDLARITFIGGSPMMLDNDSYLLGAMDVISRKVGGVQATLVNL